jgi:hypothetical protein
MKLAAALALVSLVLPIAVGHAQEPANLVRGYFAALEHKDFSRALSMTAGTAQACTANMVGTLERQAAEHHADVEVKVQRLEVGSPSNPGMVPVRFDIDVIGKKWIFRRLARKLSGTATFRLAASGDRIVAIDGVLF